MGAEEASATLFPTQHGYVLPRLVEAVNEARPVAVGNPDVAASSEAFFIYSDAAWAVLAHHSGRQDRSAGEGIRQASRRRASS